jgi:hypothetical protein
MLRNLKIDQPKRDSIEFDVLLPIYQRTPWTAFLNNLAIVHSTEPKDPFFRNQCNIFLFFSEQKQADGLA